MSHETIGLIGIAFLIVLLFLRMWVALAMALVGFFGIAYLESFGQAFLVAGTAPYVFISKYALTTLPMFVLMGNIIAVSGIGTDLFCTADKWVGQLRGGLALATTLACALLAAIAGVSSVALVTMGKIALPEMRKRKYDDDLATGCIACAGTLAFLIPPSVALIIYGILTQQSVGKLFMAGILPGLLLVALFVVAITVITAFHPQAGPAGPKTTFKEKIVSLKGVWAMLALFLLVLGGIYMGVFTPTEGGAVGAGGAILISTISRRLNLKDFGYSLVDTGLMTAMVLLLMMGASIFIKFMAISKVPFMLGETISQLAVSPMTIFAGIIILYLILGMFTDIMASILLTVPILYPVIISLGFDPIWFGVIVVIVIEIGLVTPPIGLDVFILGGVTGVPVSTIFRGVWPFCIAGIICIVILAIFPQIALFIPSTM
jgi:C4-dicarboxylate transporter DctM subunit